MSRRLLCQQGPYAGQVIEYSDSAAENALIGGWAVEPPVDEPQPEIEVTTKPAIEIAEKPVAPEPKATKATRRKKAK